jgi:uncharacterized protein (TIGR02444 family)
MGKPAFVDRLWPDMCAAYRDADLNRACLALQEAYDVDVPLLLVMCLAERAGHFIATDGLKTLVGEARAWRETVIRPLRQARHGMKEKFQAPAELALRNDIKRLELEAERLHVLRIAEALPPASKDGILPAMACLAMHAVPAEMAGGFMRAFNNAYDAEVLDMGNVR